MFDLTNKTNQGYTNLELRKALELGYKITKVHEGYHWKEDTQGIFKEYIDTFLKMKQEASGGPKDCNTAEKKASLHSRVFGKRKN